MMVRLIRRARREESGFVMVMAVVLLAAVATLSALVLSVGGHTDRVTGRGKNWAQALHVAEAGVEEAVSRLQATNGSFAGSFSGSLPEGGYDVTVTKLPRNRYTVESTGSVAPGTSGLAATRSLRVTLAPPKSFEFALFSETSVSTKNNDIIEGDIWANTSVTVEQNDIVRGDVTAATGWALLKNGSRVTGDVWTGGYNPSNLDRSIHLESGAVVEGNAKASVSGPASQQNCNGEDNTKYKVRLDGNTVQILGNVTTWGTKTGTGSVAGTISQNVCTAAPPTRSLPEFTYNPENYDPATLHEFGSPSLASPTAISDFNTWFAANAPALQGTVYINQASPVNQTVRVDMTGGVVVGDFTLITNTPIFTNGLDDNTSDAIVTLVSTYQPPTGSTCDVNQDSSECAVHLKNNFDVSATGECNTAAVVWAPYGPVAVKNNADQCGTIYSDSIMVKNNQTLIYDSRVERIVGFGPVTLEITDWVEVT